MYIHQYNMLPGAVETGVDNNRITTQQNSASTRK